MQVSLSHHADQLIERMKALGYDNPAEVIEIALERMAEEELEGMEDEDVKAWLRQEMMVGLDAAERGDFTSHTLDELKAQALARYEKRHNL